MSNLATSLTMNCWRRYSVRTYIRHQPSESGFCLDSTAKICLFPKMWARTLLQWLPAVPVEDFGYRVAADRAEVAGWPADRDQGVDGHVLRNAERLLELLLLEQVPDREVRRESERPRGEQQVLGARIATARFGQRDHSLAAGVEHESEPEVTNEARYQPGVAWHRLARVAHRDQGGSLVEVFGLMLDRGLDRDHRRLGGGLRVHPGDDRQVLALHLAPQRAEPGHLRSVGHRDVAVELRVRGARSPGGGGDQLLKHFFRHWVGFETTHRPHRGEHFHDRRVGADRRWAAGRPGRH